MNITSVHFDFRLHKVSLLCFYLKFSVLLIFVIVACYLVESQLDASFACSNFKYSLHLSPLSVNVGLGWAILASISHLNFSFDYQVLAWSVLAFCCTWKLQVSKHVTWWRAQSPFVRLWFGCSNSKHREAGR